MSIREVIVLGGAWTASLLFLLNLCNLVFGCGCTWAWAGAARHCDVHHAAPPHCPWCSHGWRGFLWVPALLLAAQAGAVLGLRKRGILAQILAAAAVFLAAGAAAGLVSALLDGYPRWLGMPLR
jgi:hypothetical protein